ncbi:MAG TPA: hypothetical protein ENK43_02975 [Planctomycetes bacterium]|nr:hypothetical protein [Planctomycetota bacterium]
MRNARSPFGHRIPCTIWIGLVALLLASLAPAQQGGKLDYRWATALMEKYRYYDMAETIFKRLEKSNDKELRSLGLLGYSKLKRFEARRTTDIERRRKLNLESISRLREVVKSLPKGSKEYLEARFNLADTLQGVATENIDQINQGRVPADQVAALQKETQNLLDEAEAVFNDVVRSLGDVDPEEDKDKWSLAVQAKLYIYQVLYNKAELLATDPAKLRSSKRIAALTDAAEGLDEFILDNEAELIGYYGCLWMGKVKAALLDAGEDVKPEDVQYYYKYVYDTMTDVPLDEDSSGNMVPRKNWVPPPAFQDLAQRACWWLFQFNNTHGNTVSTIEMGTRLRNDWKRFKIEFNLFGKLAMIEYAKALHSEGRSAEALEVAANVSAGGGFAGQEADKLMSVIIATARNKESFSPSILAAGANGAYTTRNRPGKAVEAIQLYQTMLANLGQVKDAKEKAILGRTGWYRIGVCCVQQNRYLEGARAFELGYKNYNNDLLSDEEAKQKINKKMSQNWISALGTLVKATNKDPYVRSLYDEATSYLIDHPPVGAATSTDGLAWQKAENLRRQKKYDEALKEYARLANKVGEYRERAKLKIATIQYLRLYDKKEKAPGPWISVAKNFEEFKKLAGRSDATDSTQKDARKAALVEADFYIADSYLRAAKATAEPKERRRLHDLVLRATDGLVDRIKDPALKARALYDRFQALIGLGRLDEAEAIFNMMVENPPPGRILESMALSIYKRLKVKAKGMPTRNEEDFKARDAVVRKAAKAYRVWLFRKNPRKIGEWVTGYKLFYDLEDWADANEVLEKAIAKFDGKPKYAKKVKLMKRKQARCMLELAKAAYASGDKAKTEALFAKAANVYKELVGPDNKAPATILEEAAQIFGGFLAGPDRRGNYTYYPGIGEFERASKMWAKVRKYQEPKLDDPSLDAEKERRLKKSIEQARFYAVLTYYWAKKTANDNRGLQYVKKQVNSIFFKTRNQPGAPWFTPYWEWLRNRM